MMTQRASPLRPSFEGTSSGSCWLTWWGGFVVVRYYWDDDGEPLSHALIAQHGLDRLAPDQEIKHIHAAVRCG